MNILCPSCHSSIPVSETDPLLRCDSCGLTTDISSIGTYPGSGAGGPIMRDLTGEQIGGYRISALIGVGGMGVVYRATRIEDGNQVAFKALFDSFEWKREEFVARFEREARALARLEHPGIVRILDSGKRDDLYFIVTELVDGANLAEQLRSGQLELSRIVDVMRQICPALTFAHESGVVHRDIKPANIMVTGDAVKILDFGLAQMTGGDSQLSSLTRTDLAMGTFNYLSPEQRTNAKQVDQRSDIFSLGVVFFEMLTGTLPLGSFQPPSRLREDADEVCDRIVERSLSADPADRYQSVGELAADLERIGSARPRRKLLLLAGAAGLAGVAATIALALFLGAGPDGGDDEPADLQLMQGKGDPIPAQQAILPEPPVQTANEPLANTDLDQGKQQQAAIEEPEPPPTKMEPVDPTNENKVATKKPVKKRPVKKKVGSKKKPGGKIGGKGLGGKGFGGKGSDELGDLLANQPPITKPTSGPKKPAPVADDPPQAKNPPAQTEQKKTKGKKKKSKTKYDQLQSSSTK